MWTYNTPLRDMHFFIEEVLQAPTAWAQTPALRIWMSTPRARFWKKRANLPMACCPHQQRGGSRRLQMG